MGTVAKDLAYMNPLLKSLGREPIVVVGPSIYTFADKKAGYGIIVVKDAVVTSMTPIGGGVAITNKTWQSPTVMTAGSYNFVLDIPIVSITVASGEILVIPCVSK